MFPSRNEKSVLQKRTINTEVRVLMIIICVFQIFYFLIFVGYNQLEFTLPANDCYIRKRKIS